MNVRGIAVKTSQLYVKIKYPEIFNKWINSLTDKSKFIMNRDIIDNYWYDIDDAFIEPTKKICDLFFNGKDQGAWEIGRFSAVIGLKSMYKAFAILQPIDNLLKRAAHIMSTYYQGSEIKAEKIGTNSAYLYITKFGKPNYLVELRIGGWVERALEISGCKNAKVVITKSLSKGDDITEYKGIWD